MILFLELIPGHLSAFLFLLTACKVFIAEGDHIVSYCFCADNTLVKTLIPGRDEVSLNIVLALPSYASIIAVCVLEVTYLKVHVSVVYGSFCANALPDKHIPLLFLFKVDIIQAVVACISIF